MVPGMERDFLETHVFVEKHLNSVSASCAVTHGSKRVRRCPRHIFALKPLLRTYFVHQQEVSSWHFHFWTSGQWRTEQLQLCCVSWWMVSTLCWVLSGAHGRGCLFFKQEQLAIMYLNLGGHTVWCTSLQDEVDGMGVFGLGYAACTLAVLLAAGYNHPTSSLEPQLPHL